MGETWARAEGRIVFRRDQRWVAASLVAARLSAILVVFAVLTIFPSAAQDRSDDEPARSTEGEMMVINGLANRAFVQAMQLIEQANRTYDRSLETTLLRQAADLLAGIVEQQPESALAVQLATNQFIGDFDYFEFQARIKSLVCDETMSSLCFLHRLEALLPPIEVPISTARWDWLSLSIAHYHFGDRSRTAEILAPFLSAVRRGAVLNAAAPDLFVARALALTGEYQHALALTRSIIDCSTRVFNLADIARGAAWSGRTEQALDVAREAGEYVDEKGCKDQLGLVARSLVDIGREVEAREVFRRAMDGRVTRFREAGSTCCPPELAVLAAQLDDVNLALGLLRVVEDNHPWAIPLVLAELSRRGEFALTLPYAEQITELPLRAEVYAAMAGGLVARGAQSEADLLVERVRSLAAADGMEQPMLFAHQASAERWFYNDARWRLVFRDAVTAAERGDSFMRRDIGAPLLAALVKIETGRGMLD